jgi:hypothetical protein
MNEYSGEDRRRNGDCECGDGSWHLKKEVPIATIFTILISIATGAYYISSIEREVVIVKHDLQAHVLLDNTREERQAENDRIMLQEMREIRKDITAIKIAVATNGHKVDSE